MYICSSSFTIMKEPTSHERMGGMQMQGIMFLLPGTIPPIQAVSFDPLYHTYYTVYRCHAPSLSLGVTQRSPPHLTPSSCYP
mmetsp:Transcript_11945/g.19521  ORF Transcript_11945/g.19521 Transcript_11945/m.19521 type:complete len:82 (-) Transcript_11945:1051-1296(-)